MTSAATPDDLPRLSEQVRAAERALDDARAVRDEAIRQVRRTTSLTTREIAEMTELSEPTVKTIVRGVR